MLELIFLSSFLIFSTTYLAYYLYIKKHINKPWNIKVNIEFEPEISILIPTHNEEKNIETKLENLRKILYPKKKMEIIVVDDASNDGTIDKVESFMRRYSDLAIKLVRQNTRVGKSAALNRALRASTKPIVVVSDADTTWSPDILQKALPFMADPRVGAVTGRGLNENFYETWVTRSEELYLQLTNFIRLGESKVHSTIRFEGGFCAFKRSAFDTFDHETGSDDSGTALKVVLNGYRSILVPDAVFYSSFPPSLLMKFKIKLRRANHLIALWIRCFKLLLKRRFFLPKRIAIPEIMLFIFNPMIFLASVASGITLIIMKPFSPLSLTIIFSVLGLLVFARRVFIEFFIDNIVLAGGLVSYICGKRYISWKK
ncbi:MAG: glycosyltransferase [Candidatus Bathyarchaeia archaeon]